MRCFCHNDTVKYRFMKLSWVQYDMQHQLCKYFLEKGKQVKFIYTKQECAGLYKKKKKKWSKICTDSLKTKAGGGPSPLGKSKCGQQSHWKPQTQLFLFLFLCSKKQLIYFPNTLLSNSLHGLTTNYAQIL